MSEKECIDDSPMIEPLTEEEKIVKEHTEWATGFFKFAYEQALRHGIKHGKELK